MKKIGILVVAYNAASTLAQTLDRIPADFVQDIHEVLVGDDHSQDSTYLVGARLPAAVQRPAAHHRPPPENLGYGGNQKWGYQYAIEHGWDVVVLLHGDGQYAPELLPPMIAADRRAGEADAVFGSRIMNHGEARQGGMPLYKFVGNRILTTFQNAWSAPSLTEWHSGYRAYDVRGAGPAPARRQRRRLQLRHRDHHPAARGRVPDRRDPDPHLLRRRDLLRRRHEVRQGRHPGRRCGTGPTRWASAPARRPSPHEAYEHQGGRRHLPRPHPAVVGAAAAGAGARPRLLRRRARRAHPRSATRWSASTSRSTRACASGWPTSTRPTSTRGCPPERRRRLRRGAGRRRARARPRARARCSTRSRHAPAPRRSGGHQHPQLRPLVPARCGWPLGRFDYDARGILDRGHLRFFTRRSFARMVARGGLGGPAPGEHRAAARGRRSGRRRGRWRARAGASSPRPIGWRSGIRPTLFAYQFLYELAPTP